MEPETNHKLHDETGATERTPTPYAMEEAKKRAKRQRNLGCLISFLFVFGLVGAVLLDACRHERYKAWYAHRYEPLNREVLEPLKKKYDCQLREYMNLASGFWSIDFIMSFQLEIGKPEQAFDIVRDIYALKRNSSWLSREVLAVEIVCSDPRNPVKFRVMMPGENGYEGRWIAYPPDSNPKR